MKLYWERKSKSLLYIKTSNSVIDQAVQANNIKAMLTQSVNTEIMFLTLADSDIESLRAPRPGN